MNASNIAGLCLLPFHPDQNGRITDRVIKLVIAVFRQFADDKFSFFIVLDFPFAGDERKAFIELQTRVVERVLRPF